MDLVADASAFLAVSLNEPERERVIGFTKGATLVSPVVLPYEIGNALVAAAKKGRLDHPAALHALRIAQGIPVHLVPVDVAEALQVAFRLGLYAYDAYYLQCARETGFPLLTLDARMGRAARILGLSVVE